VLTSPYPDQEGNGTPAHRALATQKKLAYMGFQCLDHPPYSPDLAPSDYHLFPGLKRKQLRGKQVELRTYQHPGKFLTTIRFHNFTELKFLPFLFPIKGNFFSCGSSSEF
jgi:hypothetical protein